MKRNHLRRVIQVLGVLALTLGVVLFSENSPAQAQTDTARVYLQTDATDVSVDDVFDVNLRCESTANATPLFSCFADVGYPSSLIEVQSISYSSEYPNYQQGVIEAAAVTNLGAVSAVNVVNDQAVPPTDSLIATLTVRALAEGTAAFTVSENTGDFSEVTVYGLDDDQRPDTLFEGLSVPIGPATLPGIVLSPAGPLTLTETGEESVTINITLATQPSASVTVPLNLTTNQCRANRTSATIGVNAWDTGVNVIVTAKDDPVDDGDNPCNLITNDPSSSDSDYDILTGADVPDVSILIIDDDTTGVVLSPAGPLTLTETGAESQTINVSLSSEPRASVTIPLNLTTNQCRSNRTSVTIPRANYQTGLNVVITPKDDPVDDGDQPCNLITNDPSSTDSTYDALTANDVPDVDITVVDDDTAGFVIEPAGPIVISEQGSQSQTFSFQLSSEPRASVSIPVSVSSNECNVNRSTATIARSAWSTGLNVVVTAVDDTALDGDLACDLVTGNPTSTDSTYDVLGAGDTPNIDITVTDNDGPTIIANPTGPLTMDENVIAFQNVTFTLNLEPAATVRIPVSPGSDACELNRTEILLNASNYQTGMIVAARPVDDRVQAGDRSCGIVTGDPFSSDAQYDALTAANSPDIDITVNDNGFAIVANPAGPLTLQESNPVFENVVYTLTIEPTASVNIPVTTSSDACELNRSSIVLSAANYQSGVTVAVRAVDDGVAAGDRACNIVTGDPTSGMNAYDLITAAKSPDVSVTVQDSASVASTLAMSSLPAGTNLITNGDFDSGTDGFTTFGDAVASTADGVLSLSAADGFVSQGLPPVAVAAETSFQLTADLANPSESARDVTLTLVSFPDSATFEPTETLECTFSLAAGAPMGTYTLQAQTSATWNMTFVNVELTDGIADAAVAVDNLDLQIRPDIDPADVVCAVPASVSTLALSAPMSAPAAAAPIVASSDALNSVSQTSTDEWNVTGAWAASDGAWTVSGADVSALQWATPISTADGELSLTSDLSGGTAVIQVQADGGDWQSLAVMEVGTSELSYDLSAYPGQQVSVRFVWIGGASDAEAWTLSGISAGAAEVDISEPQAAMPLSAGAAVPVLPPTE